MPDWLDEPFSFETGVGSLAGSLRIAKSQASPAPGALLLAGSGPIDRDGNAAGIPIGIQLAIADELAGQGIASLRFDRRGISDGGDWREASFADNLADASAALAALASDPRVDAARIVVIGHSEGALHAIQLAARQDSGPKPAATVLLAGAARQGAEILKWQAEAITRSQPAADQDVAVDEAIAQSVAAQAKIRATDSPVSEVDGVAINAGWMREFFDYNPADDLQRVAGPLLAVTGGKDQQVPPADLEQIAELVPGPCQTLAPENITHMLRTNPAAATLADYSRQLQEPVDAELLSELVGWVAGVLEEG